jgi:alpha-tubulin suppressor-like RCC1 family protein
LRVNDDRMLSGLTLAALLVTACGPNGSARSVPWTEPLEVVSLGSGDSVVVAGGHVRSWGSLDALASQLQGGVVSVTSGKGALGYPRCAVTKSGQVSCWGCVAPGRVGQYLPPATQPIANVRQAVVGQTRACALDMSGVISCWGAEYPNRSLDYSDSAICQRSAPERISRQPQFPAASRIAMTMDGRVCALTASGEVFCEGTFRALTDALLLALGPDVGLPQPVPERGVRKLIIPRARDLVAGNGHFCALGVDGSVTCWDENQYGQSGAPTEPCVEYVYGDGCKVAPHRVRLDERATLVATGAHHSCAILEDQTVACWGNNPTVRSGSLRMPCAIPAFAGSATWFPSACQVFAARVSSRFQSRSCRPGS